MYLNFKRGRKRVRWASINDIFIPPRYTYTCICEYSQVNLNLSSCTEEVDSTATKQLYVSARNENTSKSTLDGKQTSPTTLECVSPLENFRIEFSSSSSRKMSRRMYGKKCTYIPFAHISAVDVIYLRKNVNEVNKMDSYE